MTDRATPPRRSAARDVRDLLAANALVLSRTTGFPDAVVNGLVEFGRFWGSPETIDYARMAERHPPVLRRYDPAGERIDAIEAHPAFHALTRRSVAEGLHVPAGLADDPPAVGIAARARAIRMMLAAECERGHLKQLSTTHAVAPLLSASPPVARTLLISRIYDRTSRPLAAKRGLLCGLAVAERHAGTDAHALRTTAVTTEDGARLSGRKWFVSAPAGDAFVTAAVEGDVAALFLVPRLLPDGSPNGVRFEGLKETLGERSAAVADMRLEDAFGWPLAPAARLAEVAAALRLDASLAAVAAMRAGLVGAVRALGKRRRSGTSLASAPLMRRVLADLSLDLAGGTLLALRIAEALDRADDDQGEAVLAGFLVPAAAYWTCKLAPAFLAEAIECAGGNALVEDSDLPRCYRDVAVGPVWGGPGNAMALDLLSSVRRDPEAFSAVLEGLAREAGPRGAILSRVVATASAMAGEDEGASRLMTEQLALLGAAAALRRDAPEAIADAFIESRLGRPWRSTYGMLDARYDASGIVAYVAVPPDTL